MYSNTEIWSGGSGEEEIISLKPCSPIPAYHPSFIMALQVCVNLICILSMLGAALIICTFIFYKTLRTRARQILVQLSIADFFVAASHLVGVNFNLRKYAGLVCLNQSSADLNIIGDTLCKVQGGVTTYSIISSLFWTIAVAAYLLTVIVFESQRVGKWMTYAFYPLCWGLSGVVILSYALKKSFGFHPNVDTGWCSLRDSNQLHNSSNTSSAFTASEISIQVFIYLTYFILLFLYLWIRCAIRFKIRHASNRQSISYKLQLKAKSADIKLTFIPLIFISIHIWGTILGVAYLYLPESTWARFRETRWNAAFVMLSAVGSSSQGFTNAMLFCLFTSAVRRRIVQDVKKYLCCLCCKKDNSHTYLLSPSTDHASGKISLENTTEYDDVRAGQGSVNVDFIPQGIQKKSRLDSTTGQYRASFDASKSHSSVGKRESVWSTSKSQSVSVEKRLTVGPE